MKVVLLCYLLIQLAAGWQFLPIMSITWKIIYLVTGSISLVFYYFVHFKNPGVLEIQIEQKQNKRLEQSIEDQQQPPLSQVRIPKNPQIPAEKIEAQKLQTYNRYCRLCLTHQPIRTKHCYDCQKCITTFDHHCPWVDNCIGQKNKPIFLLYLMFQISQITIGLIFTIYFSVEKLYNINSHQLFKIFALGSLLILLSILLIFHLYLMITNMTTWEFTRGNKISYLKNYQGKKSPFSKTLKQNLIQYWSGMWVKDHKNWILDINSVQ